ncbi:hypothetical protein RSOLAG22IIIB_01318 [Rhizoctonia solani]|uniref:SCP domain-containing protein n=1 Tax=Rhizoctonia solani TaxID=456999 RepID=A0A0K6G5N1_9AGAM|nr:hypothetical protein RSOLAG22IIIB_01318 [Rhizoctonia solani]
MVSFTALVLTLVAAASSVSAHWHGKTFNTTEIHMTGIHLEFNTTLHTARGLSGRTEWSHQEYIDAHKNEHAKHGATAIVWDDFLSASAQAWSDQCKFERSRAGQNLAAGTGGPTPAVAVGWWNAEACEYDPKNPKLHTGLKWFGRVPPGSDAL